MKTLKRVLSMAMALMLLVAGVVMAPVDAKADEYNAKFSYASADWGLSVWGDTDTTQAKVTGEGTYSFSWEPGAAATGAAVFVVDIEGAGAAYAGWSVKDVKLTLDGTDLAVDESKIVVADTEENGNLRISFFNSTNSNEIGDTAAAPFAYDSLTFSSKIELTFTLTSETGLNTGISAPDPGTEDPGTDLPTFDPAGKYNAYLGVQTPNWTYRNAWNDTGYTTNPDLWGDFIYGNETGEKYGKVVDAVVEGNGTYKVSVTDFGTVFEDDFTAANQDYFNLLFISTDIPVSDDIKVTDVNLYIDGKKVHTDAEAFLDPDATDYVKILIQNTWNPEKAEISYYNAPTTSLEMEFTISGFNYDNAAQGGEDTETPDTTTDTEATDDTQNTQTGGDDKGGNNDNLLPIIIVVVVVVVVAVVAVVVLKKKKAE